MMYRDIKALGYSDRDLDETARYLVAYCQDKGIIEKYLVLIEGLQKEEDKGSAKLKSNYYGTLSVLHAKLGNNAKAKEFKRWTRKSEPRKRKSSSHF